MCAAVNPVQATVYLCFDPRDPAQYIADRTTWKPSHNAVLISATMLLSSDGSQPICWERVAALATLCEQESDGPAARKSLQSLLTSEESNTLLRTTLSRPTR